jgi:hypothetical protein
MANMSSATGVFEISQNIITDKDGRKHIENFFRLTEKYLSRNDYCTCLLMNLDEIKFELDSAIESGYDPEVEFDGTGRWNYMVNVENYFSWLLDQISEDEKASFFDMCEYLSQPDTPPIVMRYVDVEIGMHVYEGHQIEIFPQLNNESSVDTIIQEVN